MTGIAFHTRPALALRRKYGSSVEFSTTCDSACKAYEIVGNKIILCQ